MDRRDRLDRIDRINRVDWTETIDRIKGRDSRAAMFAITLILHAPAVAASDSEACEESSLCRVFLLSAL